MRTDRIVPTALTALLLLGVAACDDTDDPEVEQMESEEMTEDMTEDMTEEMTEDMTEEMTEDMTEDMEDDG